MQYANNPVCPIDAQGARIAGSPSFFRRERGIFAHESDLFTGTALATAYSD